MIRFVLRRLLLMLPMVLIALSVTFVMVQMAPGSPFSSRRRLPPEIEANLKAKYGFDQPKLVQYGRFMARLVGFRYEGGTRGYQWLAYPDFGDSTKYKDKSVNQIIKEALPVSAVLGLFAYALALTFGLGLGVLAAYKQNTWIDHSANGIAMFGIAVPNFILGPVLVLVFSLTLYWLPPARLEWAYEWGYLRIPTLRTVLLPAVTLSALYIAYIARLTRSGLVETLKQEYIRTARAKGLSEWRVVTVLLPALTLSALYIAYIARLTRSGLVETLKQEYIRTARAKGLSEWRVVTVHALRGAILPVVSFSGPAIAFLLTGTVVVERMFAIPGLGAYFIDAANNRDHFLILGLTAFGAIALMFANLLVDITYALIDPRIRYE